MSAAPSDAIRVEEGLLPFSFRAVPAMLVEWGGARRLGPILAEFHAERDVLLVTDAGLHRAGALEPAKRSLVQSGFRVTVFDAVIADPPESVLMACVEAARASGLSMGRMRVLALAAAAVAAGAAVAVAGVIGFVGLAAPHLVRAAVRGDAKRILAPSALAGGLMLIVADLLARLTPTDQELKLGVFTALIGAPLFALIAWRAAREWRL